MCMFSGRGCSDISPQCWRTSDDGHCWLRHVRCFMYFYIKQVTLDGTIIYFNSNIVCKSKFITDSRA
jgi:hypothetical protein